MIELDEQLKQSADVKKSFGLVQTLFITLAIEFPDNKQIAQLNKDIARVKNEEEAEKIVGEIKKLIEAAKTNPHNNELKPGARGALPWQFRLLWREGVA
jgi:hypothetical protein